ncbi:MAG: universal stress protein [Rhizobacter sp.]|nr:universal stress protein [Rhizobacter sp.]
MYDRILVPYDGSQPSQRGLQEAVSIARALDSKLVLLHVIDAFPKQLEMASAEVYRQSTERLHQRGEALLNQARATATEAGVAAESLLRDIEMETVADAIVDQVRRSQCTLIVMGTHGRRGMRRLAMGSDAELVLRESPVPVLLVRRDDERT